MTSSSIVDGVWNNYEGLPANYSDRIDQLLARGGDDDGDGAYDAFVNGKADWTTGAHSENVYRNAWTM